MYIDVAFTRSRGKVYKRVLLRTSYREGKKVKHKTIANLSDQSDETIEAIRIALANKKDINTFLANSSQPTQLTQGLSVGALFTLAEEAKRASLIAALGSGREGKLALWQILARIIAQGSRLSAVRLAARHAVCDILNLEPFTEDDLYHNLDWLTMNQEKIEQALFKSKAAKRAINLFLYDVTSSYAEGEENYYAEFGYNRDKKKGKRQIVIGLLTDHEGDPVSIEVFHGNTADTTTFIEQIHKVSERFGVEKVIWVGDRGMIKKPQIDALPEDAIYITAITKPQMMTLLKSGKIHKEDFSDKIKEVADGGVRYILRRNPIRATEILQNQKGKIEALKHRITEKRKYLQEHPKAKIEKARKDLLSYAKTLRIHKWIGINPTDLELNLDEEARAEESFFDGCYVIKTNATATPESTSQVIHDRYKDLSEVEWAFRTMKTSHLEVRPYYVRKDSRTEGHVLVVMLAYKLIRRLREAWKHLNLTVEEGVLELAEISSLLQGENPKCQYVPKQSPMAYQLLKALDIQLPEVLPFKGEHVATRKKLEKRR